MTLRDVFKGKLSLFINIFCLGVFQYHLRPQKPAVEETMENPCFYRSRVRSLATLVIVTSLLITCHLVDLIDVTLACEDANSKRVEVVREAIPREKCSFFADLEAEVLS